MDLRSSSTMFIGWRFAMSLRFPGMVTSTVSVFKRRSVSAAFSEPVLSFTAFSMSARISFAI